MLHYAAARCAACTSSPHAAATSFSTQRFCPRRCRTRLWTNPPRPPFFSLPLARLHPEPTATFLCRNEKLHDVKHTAEGVQPSAVLRGTAGHFVAASTSGAKQLPGGAGVRQGGDALGRTAAKERQLSILAHHVEHVLRAAVGQYCKRCKIRAAGCAHVAEGDHEAAALCETACWSAAVDAKKGVGLMVGSR